MSKSFCRRFVAHTSFNNCGRWGVEGVEVKERDVPIRNTLVGVISTLSLSKRADRVLLACA